MSQDTTLPGIGKTDYTDATDRNLVTDFTQVVSCAVGKNRAERQRQKIRDELVRDYIHSNQEKSPKSRSIFRRLFKLHKN